MKKRLGFSEEICETKILARFTVCCCGGICRAEVLRRLYLEFGEGLEVKLTTCDSTVVAKYILASRIWPPFSKSEAVLGVERFHGFLSSS